MTYRYNFFHSSSRLVPNEVIEMIRWCKFWFDDGEWYWQDLNYRTIFNFSSEEALVEFKLRYL